MRVTSGTGRQTERARWRLAGVVALLSLLAWSGARAPRAANAEPRPRAWRAEPAPILPTPVAPVPAPAGDGTAVRTTWLGGGPLAPHAASAGDGG